MHAAANAYDQGLKLSSQGRHLEAIGCFEQALAASPDDTRVLFALGNTARALGLAAAGASNSSARCWRWSRSGWRRWSISPICCAAQGQFDAAIALLEPALAREPRSPELHLTLGSAWREKGDNAQRRATITAPRWRPVPIMPPRLANLADLLADDGRVR